ncbi:ATP-binding protein [Chitinibacteraceae bacterium HSL-7]
MKRFEDWLSRSLLRRLGWHVALATLAVWLLLGIGFFLVARHAFGELLEHRLRATADLLVELHVAGQLGRHPAYDGDGRVLFALYDANGKLLSANRQPALPLSPELRGRPRIFSVDDERWSLLLVKDDVRQLVVGERADWQAALFDELLEHLGWPIGVAVLVLLPLLYWAVRRALLPLQVLSAELAERGPNDLNALSTPAPREIAALTTRLNTLFGQLNDVLARERRFTSDAAHELRTPIAGVQVQLDVAATAADPERRVRALAHAREGVSRMTRLVTQLLQLARLDALPVQTRAALPVDELGLRRWLEVEGDARVVVHGSGAHLYAEPDLMRIALKNLIDNGLRHGAAPVELRFDEHGVTICDGGRGVERNVVDRLGERFYRPTGTQESGSGLGLSIVRRVAELHGIRCTFDLAPSGGLLIRLAWPLAGAVLDEAD